MDTAKHNPMPPTPYRISQAMDGRWHLAHDGERLTCRGYPTRAMAYRCAVMRHKLDLDGGREAPLRDHFLNKHLEN